MGWSLGWMVGLSLASVLAVECTTRGSTGEPLASASPGPAPGLAAPATVPPASTLLVNEARLVTEDEKNTIDVFKKAAPATVFVTQKRRRVNRYLGVTEEVAQGSGSGFVWDTLGHIVTNSHVIHGAQALEVTLDDQTTYDAEVVGTEPRKDIAVLKLKDLKQVLTPIVVAKDQQLTVGQKTLAIGNPFGLDHTLTTGIVSALGRDIPGQLTTIRDAIQTDAAINPGNSGGPLLNSAGELIGMNTAIFSPSGSSAGIGFAIPGNVISRVVPQLIEHGRVEQVGLGVEIDPYQKIERQVGIRGVIVLRVLPQTPAEKAGLQGISVVERRPRLGDIIIGIGGEPVNTYDDLYSLLDKHKPGDNVEVVLRQGQETRKVKLDLIRLP